MTAVRTVRIGLAWGAALVLLAFLALPVLALVLRVSPASVLARLGDREVLDALRVSLITSLAATAIVAVLGTPLAWLLATDRLPGGRVLEWCTRLPMVLPPTVAGLALLLAFGRMGLLGGALAACGVTLPFTLLAVVLAQVFMAAPFFLATARAGFAAVPREVREAAAMLRADDWTTFTRVVLPLARRAWLAGLVLCWARALGEFGASILFAGNLAGVTRTLPMAVYLAFASDLDAAIALALILLLAAFVVLFASRWAPMGAVAGDRDA